MEPPLVRKPTGGFDGYPATVLTWSTAAILFLSAELLEIWCFSACAACANSGQDQGRVASIAFADRMKGAQRSPAKNYEPYNNSGIQYNPMVEKCRKSWFQQL